MSTIDQPNGNPQDLAATSPIGAPKEFRRILVPLDGSIQAEAVLPVATRLADACGATIVLLHVLEKGAPSTVHGDRHLTDKREAEAYLTELTRQLSTDDRLVQWHSHEVPVGDVAASVAVHAEEHEIDLILLSTHGAGGIHEAIWGSIAQQTVQHSSLPVLLIRAQAETARQAFAPQTIMVTLDATAAAEAALPVATTLARSLQAQLRLVMVVATIDTVSDDQLPTATLLPGATHAILDAQQEQATAYLERVGDQIRSRGIPVLTEVRRGETVRQLATDADEHNDGLVVAATHGRAGFQAIWSHSVAARLLRRTRAPILLVPIVEPN